VRRYIKKLLLGDGERPHAAWFGIGRGWRFIIDAGTMSQRIVGLNEAELAGPSTGASPAAAHSSMSAPATAITR